jgi:phosphate transport system permease protein
VSTLETPAPPPQPPAAATVRPLAKKRARPSEQLFKWLVVGLTAITMAMLIWLLTSVLIRGAGSISWAFLTDKPSSNPAKAGFNSALRGSIVLMMVTIFFAWPIGVAAALYLEKFAAQSATLTERRLRERLATGRVTGLGATWARTRLWWLRIRPRVVHLVDVNISNLAAVPSIIYGLLGLAIFVGVLGISKSLLAGGLTLAVLILPIIIIAAREALRAVPMSIEQGAMALGATRWQAVRRQVFPAALPGILTGTILAMSRAIGETAPLIVVGGVVYSTAVPSLNPLDAGNEALLAMPLQIYFWTDQPQASFQAIAAAGIIVLLATLLVMNLAAIILRNRYSKRW